MTLVDLISQANSIFGFAVLLVTTAAGLVIWIRKSMKAVATEVSKAVLASMAAMDVRIDVVEAANTDQTKKLESVERAVANLGARMQTAETTISALPTSKDIHQLALAMTRIEGDIGKLDERLKPIGAIATRLQEFQLENGAQK